LGNDNSKRNSYGAYKLKDNIVYFIGVRTIDVPEVEFIGIVQNLSKPDVTFHLVNANSVYGPAHLLGVLKINLECQSRGLALSQKPEIDLLLRLSFTNQINSALSRSGLKRFNPAIIILYSTDKKKLDRTRNRIMRELPKVDNSVLTPSEGRREHLFHLLDGNISRHLIEGDDNFITRYLIERSALVIK
jgi:tRNA threonylcarbamoyladenosine modification (KEOPS) complex Cgi121 subunit